MGGMVTFAGGSQIRRSPTLVMKGESPRPSTASPSPVTAVAVRRTQSPNKTYRPALHLDQEMRLLRKSLLLEAISQQSARNLKLHTKGRIAASFNADLFLDSVQLTPRNSTQQLHPKKQGSRLKKGGMKKNESCCSVFWPPKLAPP